MYYDDGQLEEKGAYKGGGDGPYESYHRNGQPWISTTYKGGQRDGPYQAYNEAGRLTEEMI
ncbi:MAG: hypothetical protein CM1200mP14_28230 [Gammaproteobacteria bacterium]|nr:MAG: hypothetical protein CM1200mP14_28230 [Gammaproteobacteria bacterium]